MLLLTQGKKKERCVFQADANSSLQYCCIRARGFLTICRARWRRALTPQRVVQPHNFIPARSLFQPFNKINSETNLTPTSWPPPALYNDPLLSSSWFKFHGKKGKKNEDGGVPIRRFPQTHVFALQNARNFVYLRHCVYARVTAECIVGVMTSVDSSDLSAADGADGLLSAVGL